MSLNEHPKLGGRTLAFHVARAASVPGIAASRALLAANARRVPVRHSWGANDAAGVGLVCLSPLPSWAIQNSRFPGEEAAILGFGIRAVLGLPGVYPCPLNSGSPDATLYLTGEVDPHQALGQCLANVPASELLVLDAVPLGALKLIVLSDDEAVERWSSAIYEALGDELAGAVTIRACRRSGGPHPRFPDDHEVTKPRTPVAAGVDQRVGATLVIDPAGVADVDFDELDEELAAFEEDGVGDDPDDLFNELLGDDRSERESARLSELPEDPDEDVDDDPSC